MTSTRPDPPAVPASSPDPEADARFADYLADIAAHADDPEYGDELRGFLTDDPQFQRALFDVIEAHTVPPMPPVRSTLIGLAGTLAAVIAVVAFVVCLVP